MQRIINRLLRLGLILLLNLWLQPAWASGVANIVAVYKDRGAYWECIQATAKMLEWMGYTVTLVDAAYINNNQLTVQDLSLISFPGGSAYYYAQDITPEGKENIRNFIRNGGGYLGICAGSFFASDRVVWKGGEGLGYASPLGLFPGKTIGPMDEMAVFPEYTMAEVSLTNLSHQATQAELNPSWILYYGGPEFIPYKDNDTSLAILGRYKNKNESMMVTASYGLGRVFLVSAHPEIEEDSDRDGVALADELDDQGSEWELMKKGINWCLKKGNL